MCAIPTIAWTVRIGVRHRIRDRRGGEETVIAGLRLPMPGQHNVANATAAIAVPAN